MDKLLVTYSLLGYLKETSISTEAITELYIPLVKKAMSDYALEHGLTEYKGRSLKEISDKIFSIFEINIPLPILGKIMESIEKEIGDDNKFALYNDGAFIIKSYVFNDMDELFGQEQRNIQLLKDDYRAFCIENGYVYDFEELKKFILAQQIELFSDKRSDLLDLGYFVPKYVSERVQNAEVFSVMSKIYLGSIIESYLKQNITKKVTDTELLLDTNFFISLIDLNTEDAFHTCNQVFSLCNQLGYRFSMLNSTVDEIRGLLSSRINDFANKDYIGAVKCADVFNACIRRGLDKTGLERIKDNIRPMVLDKGIVIIQDAQVKDLIEKAKKSEDFKRLYEVRNFSMESALNDMVAKLYVEKKRGQNVKEFVDAKCWFLHNSFSPYDYSYGKKIHDRYLISANELLVLLWLSNPAQGQSVSISDITKGGLASYITKYRGSKIPSQETLKIIKKRADDALAIGTISERDNFNLCIRMAEGHLTQKEVDESLIADNVSDLHFAEKLKEYSNEIDENNKRQRQMSEEKISELNNEIEGRDSTIRELQTEFDKEIKSRDSRIQNLQNDFDSYKNSTKAEIEELKKASYNRDKQDYVKKEINKVKRDTWISIVIAMVIIGLWCLNEFYSKLVPTKWSSIIAVGSFIGTKFLILFFDKTRIKDYFCRKELTKRLEEEYDNKHRKELEN